MSGDIRASTPEPVLDGPPCLVCDRPRSDFPQCFTADATCSVDCAKALEAL